MAAKDSRSGPLSAEQLPGRLRIPAGATGLLRVVICTGGSAWMADTGKRTAGGLAAQLNPAGYAVAGVSIRSSSQVLFPSQLHDIKAAIRTDV